MKKLIKVLIVCGLFVVMGGTAQGAEKLFPPGEKTVDGKYSLLIIK